MPVRRPPTSGSSPGDVIVEIAQEAVANADEFQAKIDKLKKEGRKSALLLVAGADGELRFVALPPAVVERSASDAERGGLAAPFSLPRSVMLTKSRRR